MNYFMYTSHQLDIVSYYSRSNCAGNFNQPRTLGLSDSASRLSFAWKSFVKNVKKNTTEVSTELGACKRDKWSHVLQVVWASEDKQKERLQWFHTTFCSNFDKVHQWHVHPSSNMVASFLHKSMEAISGIQDRLQLKPVLRPLKTFHSAHSVGSNLLQSPPNTTVLQKYLWSINLIKRRQDGNSK